MGRNETGTKNGGRVGAVVFAAVIVGLAYYGRPLSEAAPEASVMVAEAPAMPAVAIAPVKAKPAQMMPEDRILAEARKWIGTREATGKNDGPEVERFLKTAGAKRGDPWCAAFVCYVMQTAGADHPSGCAWSPSWFPRERLVRQGQSVGGDVFGLYYANRKRIAHVGIVDRWEGDMAVTIEGNTTDHSAIDERNRNGDGVHRKRRPARSIHSLSRWTR